jgi:hypothetical protein
MCEDADVKAFVRMLTCGSVDINTLHLYQQVRSMFVCGLNQSLP